MPVGAKRASPLGLQDAGHEAIAARRGELRLRSSTVQTPKPSSSGLKSFCCGG